MKLSYDFEKFEPPHLTAQQLNAVSRQRELARQTIILLTASQLIYICLAVAAYVLAPHSMTASIILMVFFGFSLSGSGVIAVLFSRKLTNKLRPVSSIGLA